MIHQLSAMIPISPSTSWPAIHLEWIASQALLSYLSPPLADRLDELRRAAARALDEARAIPVLDHRPSAIFIPTSAPLTWKRVLITPEVSRAFLLAGKPFPAQLFRDLRLENRRAISILESHLRVFHNHRRWHRHPASRGSK